MGQPDYPTTAIYPHLPVTRAFRPWPISLTRLRYAAIGQGRVVSWSGFPWSPAGCTRDTRCPLLRFSPLARAMRPRSGGVDPHGSRDGTLRRRNRDTPSPLGAEAPLLGRAATLIEAGESHETQGHQRVVHKAFVCEQEFNMTAVSRGAWLSMAYLTPLASLAIAIIWTVVQLRTERTIYPGSSSACSTPWDPWQEPNGIISCL